MPLCEPAVPVNATFGFHHTSTTRMLSCTARWNACDWGADSSVLGEDVFDDVSMHVRKAKTPSLEIESKPFVIQSKAM